MTRIEAIATLHKLVQIILETIQSAGPNGVPSGPLYATLNCHGLSLATYQQIMAGLVATGRVRLSGHVYYTTAVNVVGYDRHEIDL